MRHLNRCQLSDTDRLCILLVFLNKLIIKLKNTPDTATKQAVIIFYIVSTDRNILNSKIRECCLISVFLGIEYYCNPVNNCITASLSKKRQYLLCLIWTNIVITQNTLHIVYSLVNNLLIIRITILTEKIFQYIYRNICSFTN